MRQAVDRLGKEFFAGGTKPRAFAFGAATPSQELLRLSNSVNAFSPVVGRSATAPWGVVPMQRSIIRNDFPPCRSQQCRYRVPICSERDQANGAVRQCELRPCRMCGAPI